MHSRHLMGLHNIRTYGSMDMNEKNTKAAPAKKNESKKINLKSFGLENHGHLSLIPFLWADRPSVCGLAGRGIIIFPCLRRSGLVLGP